MSLKDRFDKFIDYFTEDGEETANYQTQRRGKQLVTQSHLLQELPQHLLVRIS